MKVQDSMHRRGFSLIECGALVLVLSMIGMTMAPTMQQVRSSMRGAGSAANLMQIGQGAGAYGFSNQGRLFSYSWRAGDSYIMPDGRVKNPSSDLQAAAFQNQEILMRQTGRLTGQFKIQNFSARIPHRRSTHLVLMDYMNEPFGSDLFIDPSDANQQQWKDNPLDYFSGSSVPYADGIPDGYDSDSNWTISAVRQRWAFASSYQVVPSAWQFDFPNARFIPVASTPHLFQGGNGIDLHTGRNISEVAYPSQKVWMFEEFDREQAGSPYFAYPQAQSEKLMFDLSVNSWASGDANSAVVPEYGMFPWKQTYVPLDTFPVPIGGLGDARKVNQRFRWTFRGLLGFDYGLGDPGRGPTQKMP
jgi:competence protein ComGC